MPDIQSMRRLAPIVKEEDTNLVPGREHNKPDQLEALLAQGRDDAIEFQLSLRGSQLRNADPVPILIHSIQETADLHAHRRTLFTILTELYVNALDHGILQLDSNLKQGEDGFTRYFQHREQRLQSLTEGEIRIGLRLHNRHRGGCLVIQVEDSGRGFDSNAVVSQAIPETLFSGRGIVLVRSLCKQLHYSPPGNKAEAIYVWNEADTD